MKILVNGMNDLVTVKSCQELYDPKHEFYGDILFPHSLKAMTAIEPEDKASVAREFDDFLEPNDDVEWAYVSTKDAMVYTNPGYIYLQGSVSEFRTIPASFLIVLRLISPKADLETTMAINPHIIGYGVDTADLNTIISLLIATPNGAVPGVWDRVEMIEGDYLQHLSYPILDGSERLKLYNRG